MTFQHAARAAMMLIAVGAAALFAAPALSQVSDLNWTGPYAGFNIGGAWGGATTTDDASDGVNPGPFNYSAAGVFGGGTAGYNVQLFDLVLGIEGDLGYMDLSGSSTIGSAHADHHQDLTLDSGLYGDITGRAGWTFGRALIYGKGGFAFFDGAAGQATTSPGYKTTGTGTFTGWVAGAGVEYAVTNDLSFKLEYLHFDFGSEDGAQTNVGDDSSPIGYAFRNSTDVTADSLKVGVAYHF
jgi:outer membrane immunogenic protein